MVRRRILARKLRMLREGAGLTLEAAAPLLDWSVSKLARIETAQQPVDVHGVRSMLDLYDIGGGRWDELVTLAREARQRGWWRAYGVGDDSYVGFEAEARHVYEFTFGYAPGLLQTSDYARALLASGLSNRDVRELEDAVTVRRIRQERLTSLDHPLSFVAVIDESVLHRPVGGPEVLQTQLAHLVACAELEAVTLQVLPTAAGEEGALASAFAVLTFGDLGEPDMAYVEHALGAVMMDKPGDVGLARLRFDRLRVAALDPMVSLDLIRRVAGS